MTSLLHAFSRQSLSDMAFAGCSHSAASGTQNRTAHQDSETEYQAVFATMALLLAGGTAIVLAALSHAF
jgi:hypothetical protein